MEFPIAWTSWTYPELWRLTCSWRFVLFLGSVGRMQTALMRALVQKTPYYPHFIIAEVAPFTPHAPCATITRTSFGVIVFSVSFKSVLLWLSLSVPSAVAGKSYSLPLSTGIPAPQVQVIS